jgi:hypothetical protein
VLWLDAFDVQILVLAAAGLGVIGALWSLAGMGAAYGQIGAGFLDVSDRAGPGSGPAGTPAEQLLEVRQLTQARDALRRSRLERSATRDVSHDAARNGAKPPRPRDERRALDDLFRRLPQHFRGDQAPHLDAVIECRVNLTEGDCARYQIHIEGDRCSVRREGTADPALVLSIPYQDLVAIAAQTATASRLFLQQRLTIRGDVLLAARLPSLFQMPSLEGGWLLA